MPNWVRNHLTIECPSSERAQEIYDYLMKPFTYYVRKETRIYDALGAISECSTNGFTFHNIISPGRDAMLDESYDWYSWNSKNWGTKWDACDLSCSIDECYITIDFDTAWSEPDPVLRELSRIYPDVRVTNTWEEEQGFGEEVVYSEGEREIIDSWDIPEYEEEEEVND